MRSLCAQIADLERTVKEQAVEIQGFLEQTSVRRPCAAELSLPAFCVTRLAGQQEQSNAAMTPTHSLC